MPHGGTLSKSSFEQDEGQFGEDPSHQSLDRTQVELYSKLRWAFMTFHLEVPVTHTYARFYREH